MTTRPGCFTYKTSRRISDAAAAVARPAFGCAVVVVLAGSCSSDGESANQPARAEVGEAPLLVVDDEFEGFDQLRSDVRAWNRTVAPVVAAYLDPEVSAREFVQLANPVLPELEAIVATMRTRNLSRVPVPMQTVVDDVLLDYDNKLSALTALVIAVQMQDQRAEQAALANLQQATADGNTDACRLLEAVSQLDPSFSRDSDAFGATCA